MMSLYVLSYAATVKRTDVQHFVGMTLKDVISKAAKRITNDYHENDKKAIILKFQENQKGDVVGIVNTSYDTPQSFEMDNFFDSKGIAYPGLTRTLAEWFSINNFDCVVHISKQKI